MSSAYQVQVVSIEEFGDDVGSEGKRDSPVVLSPALNVLVRVGPEEVAQETWRI